MAAAAGTRVPGTVPVPAGARASPKKVQVSLLLLYSRIFKFWTLEKKFDERFKKLVQQPTPQIVQKRYAESCRVQS